MVYVIVGLVLVAIVAFWLWVLHGLSRDDQWNETLGKGDGSGGAPPV